MAANAEEQIETILRQKEKEAANKLRLVALQDAVSRSPAASQTETTTRKEEIIPVVSEAEKRLRGRLSELEAKRPAAEMAMQQALAEQRARLGGVGGADEVAREYDFSPETKAAIKKEEETVLSKLGTFQEPKRESDLLSTLLLAGLPTLLGAGIGAASGEIGMGWAGAGAGAKASADVFEKQMEMDKERRKLAQERYLKELNSSLEVFKERVKTLKEPELAALKSKLNFSMAASAERARQEIAKGQLLNLSQVELKNLPAVQEYNNLLEQIKTTERALTTALGKPGQVRAIKETQVKPEGKGKERQPKDLTAAQQKQLASFNATETQLLEVIDKINKNRKIFGPVVGTVGILNPYAVQAQKLKTDLGILTSSIARSAEEARISDKDIERFTQQAPQVFNDPEVAIEKAKSFLDKTRRERAAFLDVARKSGVNVPETPKPVTGGAMTPEQRKRLEELRSKFRK